MWYILYITYGVTGWSHGTSKSAPLSFVRIIDIIQSSWVDKEKQDKLVLVMAK